MIDFLYKWSLNGDLKDEWSDEGIYIMFRKRLLSVLKNHQFGEESIKMLSHCSGVLWIFLV